MKVMTIGQAFSEDDDLRPALAIRNVIALAGIAWLFLYAIIWICGKVL